MSEKAISVLFLIVAVIHFLPLQGVIGQARLAALYGVELGDPNLLVLMRHRAVMFGLFGGLFALAAFWPAAQPLALVAGLVTTVSFLVIAKLVGDYNPAIHKVVIADVVAVVCLVLAVVLRFMNNGQSS